MDKNERFIKSTKEERETMATTSFNKRFVIQDQETAQKVREHLNSFTSTPTMKTSHCDILKELNRGDELLKLLLSH